MMSSVNLSASTRLPGKSMPPHTLQMLESSKDAAAAMQHTQCYTQTRGEGQCPYQAHLPRPAHQPPGATANTDSIAASRTSCTYHYRSCLRLRTSCTSKAMQHALRQSHARQPTWVRLFDPTPPCKTGTRPLTLQRQHLQTQPCAAKS